MEEIISSLYLVPLLTDETWKVFCSSSFFGSILCNLRDETLWHRERKIWYRLISSSLKRKALKGWLKWIGPWWNIRKKNFNDWKYNENEREGMEKKELFILWWIVLQVGRWKIIFNVKEHLVCLNACRCLHRAIWLKYLWWVDSTLVTKYTADGMKRLWHVRKSQWKANVTSSN